MKKRKGITLVELIVAIALVSVLVLAVSVMEHSFYKMKTGILDKQVPAIQGNLALATMFERILRAGSESTAATAFAISPGGAEISYNRGSTPERFYLDGNAIKYRSGDTEKVILRGVKTLRFSNDYANRTTVNIELENGDTFRTSVQPRNQFTPRSVVN